MCYNLEKYQTSTIRKVWHMIKTLALDTPNIKITDNDTPIKLTPYDDGVKLEAGTWVPTVYIASNTSAFTKSIPAIWDGYKVVIQSSTLADLPVDKYDVEVWLNDGSEQLIYPDYGYVKLNINQTVAGINANLISSVTVAEFRDMFNSLATDINASISDLAVDSNVVHKTGNETVADTKTFSSPIVGSLTGNASTSTKLATTRSVQTNLASTSATNFDGTANITPGVTGVLGTDNGGNGNLIGQAQSVNSLALTIQGFAVGNTITATQTLAGIKGKLYGNYTGTIGTTTGTFAVEVTSNGDSAMAVLARLSGDGSVYTGVAYGSFTGTTFTISEAPVWVKLATDASVVHSSIGKVIMNSSSSASGETTGTWSNISSATIGSTTVYYWQRRA